MVVLLLACHVNLLLPLPGDSSGFAILLHIILSLVTLHILPAWILSIQYFIITIGLFHSSSRLCSKIHDPSSCRKFAMFLVPGMSCLPSSGHYVHLDSCGLLHRWVSLLHHCVYLTIVVILYYIDITAIYAYLLLLSLVKLHSTDTIKSRWHEGCFHVKSISNLLSPVF